MGMLEEFEVRFNCIIGVCDLLPFIFTTCVYFSRSVLEEELECKPNQQFYLEI